jgi:hypothetical protein
MPNVIQLDAMQKRCDANLGWPISRLPKVQPPCPNPFPDLLRRKRVRQSATIEPDDLNFSVALGTPVQSYLGPTNDHGVSVSTVILVVFMATALSMRRSLLSYDCAHPARNPVSRHAVTIGKNALSLVNLSPRIQIGSDYGSILDNVVTEDASQCVRHFFRYLKLAMTNQMTALLLPELIATLSQEAPNVDVQIVPWHESSFRDLDLVSPLTAPFPLVVERLLPERFVCLVLLGISRRGNTYLRKILIHGARAAVLRIKRDRVPIGAWMDALERRAHRNVLIVAMANKLARIAWAVLSSGEEYRPNTAEFAAA